MFVALALLAILSRVGLYWYFKRTNHEQAGWVSYMFTPCCFDSFAIGALLAYFRIRNPLFLKKLLKPAWIYIILAIGFFTISFFEVNKWIVLIMIPFFRFSFSVVCFWIIGSAAEERTRGIVRWFLQNRVTVYLGKISYGIYVYHYFMMYFFKSMNPIYYPFFTIALASFSWFLFEKPINNLKDKFTRPGPKMYLTPAQKSPG